MDKFGILPEEYKKYLKKEYQFRAIAVLLFLWGLFVISGILLLVPSYMLSNLRENTIISEVAKSDMENILKEKAKLGNMITAINAKTKALLPKADHYIYDTVLMVLYHQDIEIKITGITLSKNQDNKSTLLIRGNALSREALTRFVKNLEGESKIESVNLPISIYAKGKDIPFDMSIIFKEI